MSNMPGFEHERERRRRQEAEMKSKSKSHFNGNFRILKWRYVSTIFLAIFCGDIPIESGKCLNFPALHRSNVAPVVSQPSAFRGPNCQKADELVSDRPCWGAVGVID